MLNTKKEQLESKYNIFIREKNCNIFTFKSRICTICNNIKGEKFFGKVNDEGNEKALERHRSFVTTQQSQSR